MDSALIIESIASTERLLSELKYIDPKKVPSDIMSRLNKLYEKFGYLFSYWEIHNKMGYFEYKIDDSLWMNNYVMKFLFEECVTCATNSRTGLKDLFCTICNCGFPCEPNELYCHLIEPQHMTNFTNYKKKVDNLVWNEAFIYKYVFEKFIEFRVDNTLYCKICAYTIPFNHTGLVGHLDGEKHKQNFEDMMRFKFSCERNAATAAVNKENPFFEKRSVPVSNPSHQEEPKSAYTSETYQCSDYAASKILENGKQFVDNSNIREARSRINKSDSMSSLRSGISFGKYESDNVSLSGMSGSVTGEGRWDELSEKSFGASPRNSNEKGAGNGNLKAYIGRRAPRLRNYKSVSMKSFHSGMSGSVTGEGRWDEVSEKSFGASPRNPNEKGAGNGNKKTGRSRRRERPRYFKSGSMTSLHSGISLGKYDKELSGVSGSVTGEGRWDELSEKSFGASPMNPNKKGAGNRNYKEAEMKEKKEIAYEHFKKRADRRMNNEEAKIEEKKKNAEKNFEKRSYNKEAEIEEKKENAEKHFEEIGGSTRDVDKYLEKKEEDKANVDNPCYWYGIVGVPREVTEDEIKQGFSCFGVVNSVQFLKPDNVNVQVYLRKDLEEAMEDFGFKGVTVLVKGRKYILQAKIPSMFPDQETYTPKNKLSRPKNPPQKIDFPKPPAEEPMVVDFPDEVKFNFCVHHESFFEKLLSDAVKESESSLTLFNNKFLKTEKVEDETRSTLKHKYLNNLKVITVGSRATGLANNSSLHDIFIDIGNYYEDESSNPDKLMERLNDIKKYLENSQYPSFANIRVDGKFLLFDHLITLTCCKIFCGSGMVVENTELIRSYISADENIKLLIIVIREWIKFTDLSGLLSNYSITWMVLFYLMQPSVNYIKPVIVLKSIHQEPLKSISGWDCGFSNVDPSSVLWPNRKTKPVIELLLNFFKFYSNFDVNKNVLCPLTGESVSKSKFESFSLPSYSFSKYISQQKKMNVTDGICLQDPLELDKNLTEGITGDFDRKLKLYCKKMVDMISAEL